MDTKPEPNLTALTSANPVLTREAIAELLQTSPEFALKFFLGEKLEYPVGEFQKEVLPVLWQSTRDTALAIPRGFTKTTMAKIAVVLALYFRHFRFAVYGRETIGQAVNSCLDVLAFFNCANWVNTFGKIVFTTSNKSDGIWIFKFPHTNKSATLKAVSPMASSRGDVIDQDRPDFGVLDDLDQRDDSEAVRETKSIWFWATFKKGMKLHGSVTLYLANLTSDQGILQELLDDEEWNSYHYGCIKADGQALWPEMLSLAEIKKDFLRYQRKKKLYVWYQEMMNVPLPQGAIIDEKMISYVNVPEPEITQTHIGFLIVDLAISEAVNADDAAVVAFLWLPHDPNVPALIAAERRPWQTSDFDPDQGVWVPVETFNQKGLSIFQLFDKIREIATRWNIDIIFVENVSYQAAALQFYPYLAKQSLWLEAKFESVKPRNRAKADRIGNWAKHVEDKIFSFPLGSIKLTQLLLKFTPKRSNTKKDLLDACAYSVDVLNDSLNDVIEVYNDVRFPVVSQGATTGQSLYQLINKRNQLKG